MKALLRALLPSLAFSLSFLSAMAIAQTAPTGSFTLATQVNANGTLTPTLTWSTTPAATSCTASGDAAWSGTKAASGTQTLAAFPVTTPKAYALVCNWPGQSQALLTWNPVTTNTDGSALTNLAGYRINWGTSATTRTSSVQTAANVTTYTIADLAAGTWYFGVKAFTTQGAESASSNIVSRAITGPVEWSQSTGVKVPSAPVLE